MSRDEGESARQPARLAEGADRAGALLREALPLYSAGIDEPRAYARLVERRRARAPRRVAAGILLAAGAVAVVGVIGSSTWGRLHRVPPGVDPVAWSTRLSDGTEIAATAGSDARPVPSVAPTGRAADASVVTVSLARGAITVRARPARPAEDLRILAGPYRLEVAGDGVRVEAEADRIGVAVDRGEVRVWISTRLVQRVIAGARWSSPPGPATAESPTPPEPTTPHQSATPLLGPPAPSDTDAPRASGTGRTRGTRSRAETPASVPAVRAADVTSAGCLSEVRAGETRQAEGCFARLAAGPSADAELALYELARLRHDALGDDAGAASALQEYRRRFPSGALRTEAAASSFEVLSALGRYDEALAVSRVALSDSSGDEQARLRLLRGRVMQSHLGDCAGAIAEYAAAEKSLGPRRAEATFYRAQCLEKLGRRDDALAGYRTVAASPDATYVPRAKARLEELGR